VAAPTGDFRIGVSTPSPAVLTGQGSIAYPVTVSSVNGQSGSVSLSLSTANGMPLGMSYSFSATQASLSGGEARPAT